MSKVKGKHEEYANHLKASIEEILGVKFARSSITVIRRSVIAYLVLFLTGAASLFLGFLQWIGVGNFSFIVQCISILGLISLILKSQKWRITKSFIRKKISPSSCFADIYLPHIIIRNILSYPAHTRLLCKFCALYLV